MKNSIINPRISASSALSAFRNFALMCVICVICVPLSTQAQTWTNPITLTGEWSNYGIGDPYILKHRGVYYLYCSTKDNNTGVKCWTTKDFVTWSGVYSCTSEAITVTAYAPEVVYWNGTFYMYTSPGGNGHYVLSSSSPTGPFTRITENLGKSIDGSIFIDDNGQWYFYHAADNSIIGCSMSSPTAIGSDISLGARVGNGWTEGPTVFRRNGVYYLIYTGNHVISKGYRIDYATNTTGPVNQYTAQAAQNPILINTEGAVVGLGHGSAFVGPDLTSYYYTYHNLESGNGPRRHLNFDRIAWNGAKLLLLGPTTWAQQAFRQADMVDFFDRDILGDEWATAGGGTWSIKDRERLVQESNAGNAEDYFKVISGQSTAGDYAAEFTIRRTSTADADGRFGAVFGYTDEDNCGIFAWNTSTNRVEIIFRTSGAWETPRTYALPANFSPDAWHTLRIEKSASTCRFFIDGMQKASLASPLGGGKIGYATSRCRAEFGYVAFTSSPDSTGVADVWKPVPGIVAAMHYHEKTDGGASQATCSEGGYALSGSTTGQRFQYRVNVKATGTYLAGFRYSATEASRIRFLLGDTDLTGAVTLPQTETPGRIPTPVYRTFTVNGLALPAGYQTLTLESIDGAAIFYEMRFEASDTADATLTDAFTTAYSSAWNYTDGTWSIASGEADISGHGKRTMGSTGWTDCTVETDVTYFNNFNGGLIFRVNNPALGGAGNDAAAGTDFLQGYFVSLAADGVVLGKHNYGWAQLAKGDGTYVTNQKYTLKVEVRGDNIKVYVDGSETPAINYTDPRPFVCGKAGYRVCDAHVRFDNFRVETLKPVDIPSSLAPPDAADGVTLFPNPVSDVLTVRHAAAFTGLSIFRADGREVYAAGISGSVTRVDASAFSRGIYFLKLTDNTGNVIVRKFIK
ncbi:MAG: family 43 glycosylhydrolase [Tannerella sp.]|jgi:hypothetical protein|nr:family 43 glycosylhydrolase [Tannerella sp.]